MKPLWWMNGPLFEEAPNPEAPPPAGPAFDAAAFKDDLLVELRKDLNGIAKSLKTDLGKLLKPEAPPPSPEPTPTPTPGSDPEKNALALQLKRLQEDSDKRIKALETTNAETQKRAEETERDSKIRSKLADFSFATEQAKETAFQLFKGAVTRSDDGSLVAGDLPFDKFIETELPGTHAYLLAPKDVSGAGARKGGGSGPNRKFTLEDIDNMSKLSAEDQQKLRQQVAAQMTDAMAGR
jgi:hypothetical protein